jgi:S-adenosylmethionine decarboxylase
MKLENFNNLNKNLNFSFYDINYAEKNDKFSANKYIHEKYNSKRLTIILSNITKKIGAHILNISRQDYEPIASSVNFLITESPVSQQIVDRSCNLGHLDKSHIAVHTYPEYSKKTNIATFRVDINVSTCGLISPIQCINYLLKEFSTETCADIVQIDYFVRGFTRTTNDKKIFIDHQPKPISHYINNRFKKNNYIFEDIFPKLNI